MTGLIHEEQRVTGVRVRQLLDDRQDPVGYWNAAATAAVGDFDLDAFRLGTLDHQ